MRCSALVFATLAALAASAPEPAAAFCGFYVSGGGAQLFNNATQVALMREGTRTVLSMQNNYQGPPQDFAMVVPVPVVLQEENVKTLPRDIFDRLDKLSAPRLVEYWEQDPCRPTPPPKVRMAMPSVAGRAPPMPSPAADSLGVTVEARFTVGEYKIEILSARNSTGLDTWLKQQSYKIPDGAEPYLRPYVVAGMKFFVAKIDTSKVTFENGMATLSPLRFHYDSELFNLPVRLGLMNSSGTQDLIVTILATGTRYEVANYDNVTIPTNIDLAESAKQSFPSFYVSLFDATLAKHPKAVVTEYAWDARSCDPCPTPPLNPADFATLGADTLPSSTPNTSKEPAAPPGPPGPSVPPRRWRPPPGQGFVLTRLHARYSKDSLGEDLVFRAAPAIAGGRESRGENGKLEQGFEKGSVNNFQARYAVRHPWRGPITCANPVRGRWGGPPDSAPATRETKAATNLAFAPRGGVKLATFVKAGALVDPGFLASAASVPVTILAAPAVDTPPPADADAGAPPPPDAGSPDGGGAPAGASPPPPVPPESGGCAGCAVSDKKRSAGFAITAALAALGLLAGRRKSR